MPPFQYKTQPREHQRLALRKGARCSLFALRMEQGTGKTKVWLDEAAYLWSKSTIDTLVVLAPNRVHRQWVEEAIPEHFPDWVPRRVFLWLSGKTNKEMLASFGTSFHGLSIYVFNAELLSHPNGKKLLTKAMAGRKVLFVVDEFHKFKTPSSKRTRALWHLARYAKVRRMGTGTDIAKGVEDLYAPFRFLDWRIIGCQTFAEFKATYCVLRKHEDYEEIVGYRNLNDLMARIEPFCFVAEAKDCMDLPEQIFMPPLVVELTAEQKRLIRELKDDYLTQLRSGEIVEGNLAIVRLQKFQQIAGGHVSLKGQGWRPVEEHSTEATVDLIESTSEKVIVWCAWRPDVEQLEAAMKKSKLSYLTYYGGNSDTVNAENKVRFKTDPDVRVLLVTYASASTGLDFPDIPVNIFYTLTTSSLDYWQALKRTHRMGTRLPVKYHTLVRPGAMDRRLLDLLKKKENIAKLMRDPRVFKRWLEDLDREIDT